MLDMLKKHHMYIELMLQKCMYLLILVQNYLSHQKYWFLSFVQLPKELARSKENRKYNKATSKSLHHEFTWFGNVPTSTGNIAHHHHIIMKYYKFNTSSS